MFSLARSEETTANEVPTVANSVKGVSGPTLTGTLGGEESGSVLNETLSRGEVLGLTLAGPLGGEALGTALTEVLSGSL